MSERYTYVRFSWWRGVDLSKVAEDLSHSFKVEMHYRPSDRDEISFTKDDRDELKVKADTLSALLSRFQVVLYQKEAAPFTARDMELRKMILAHYPRNRPSPFPWGFSSESTFERDT